MTTFETGEMVRVTAVDGREFVGTLATFEDHYLIIQRASGRVGFPLSAIRGLEHA